MDLCGYLSWISTDAFRLLLAKIFVSILFVTAENMPCICIKQLLLCVHENAACTFHIGWNECVKFQGQLDSISKDKLKWPVSPLLEVGFKKFFDSHM